MMLVFAVDSGAMRPAEVAERIRAALGLE